MSPASPTPANRDEAHLRNLRDPGAGPSRESFTHAVRPVAGTVREGGDACPGALRLHTADDGRLARLRLPAGLLTYRQAEALANAAERLGDGHLDITSRGNVQLRGLGVACGDELAALLRQAGLLPSERHERIRNIVASPLSGLDAHGELPAGSVQLWARELDGLLCASEPATALSGRFLFALDDGRGDVAGLGADVTLLARRDGTAMVRTGASRAGLLVPTADAPRAALLAAETFLTVAEAGSSGAWRVRELPPGHGLDEAVAARLADAEITAGYVAEMPVTAVALAAEAESPAPGLIRSPGGTVALSVYAPLGRLSAVQWRLLTTAGREVAGDALRITPWRGIIVPGLEPAAADDLLDRLRTAGLITDRHSPWYGVGACTGRPGCAKALADVRADAAGALRPTPTARHGALPVYWSGCARRCGHPQGAHVDVVATAGGGYLVSVRDSLPADTAGAGGTADAARAADAGSTAGATRAASTATTAADAAPQSATTATGPELADAVAAARRPPVTR
ncbi:precorrin-3B synthase [Streptomyces odonnellii]|uniref:precorrin-3B synthase n=1 Tax=Streptomyces odonnellii TaxID=1417980 RepID=UPI001E4FA585|nr:precorrin-3B synthase [Streptomyces odonnellii]